MQTFNLDLSVKRVIPLLYAKQRNVGSKICIKLTDNETEYVVPYDVTWSVWYSGAGIEGNYDKIDDRNAVVVNGSTATVELIYHMLDYPGPGEMCLVMNSTGGTQLGLWNIPYWVEALPGADSKAATAYYQAFLQAQAKAEAAAERSEGAAARAEAAAGGNIIVSIDEGDVATHTAAEIYNAVQNHKTVVYRWDPRAEPSELIPIRLSTPSVAVFSKPGYPTEFDIFYIYIGAQGTVSYETSFSSDLVTQAVEKVETDIAPVSYLPQEPNPEQQAQARENIGIVDEYYELIETITLEEETARLVRTQEPNGTPYKFKRVYLSLIGNQSGGASGWIEFRYQQTYVGAKYMGGISNISVSVYAAVEIRQEAGSWRTTWCDWGSNDTVVNSLQYGNNYGYYPDKSIKDYPFIDSIIFTNTFPAGTELKIWGVRA